MTPAVLAYQKGHEQVMHVLSDFGVDVDAARAAARNASHGHLCGL